MAFAQGLAEAGADLVLGARRVDRLAETASLVEATGRRAIAVATDVTDPDACTALVQAGMDAFGKVDVLVNNAGLGTAVPATHETPEQFRAVIDVNLNGCYWMAQACGRVMPPGSSIVNVSSVLGSTTAGLPQAAYASSKAASTGLTRDLAAQWTGRKGIRVNAVAPGFFESEMTDQYPDGYLDRILARVPGRTRRRPGRARRHGGLPGLGRRRLRHRADADRRRWGDDHLRPAAGPVRTRRGEQHVAAPRKEEHERGQEQPRLLELETRGYSEPEDAADDRAKRRELHGPG